MRIFNRSTVDRFRKKYPDADGVLKSWLNTASSARWKNLADVQATYSNSAEAVGNFTVFNIKGNKYRLIVDVACEKHTIFIKYFLTHADYDKGDWKK